MLPRLRPEKAGSDLAWQEDVKNVRERYRKNRGGEIRGRI